MTGGGTPEWLFVVDATPIEPGSSIYKLNKTYAEIKSFVDSDSADATGVGVALMSVNGTDYRYTITDADYSTYNNYYYVSCGYEFTADSEDDYPTHDVNLT